MTIRLRSASPRWTAIRYARCWTASIVWPCRPMNNPRSVPWTVPVMLSSSETTSTEALSPSASTTRSSSSSTSCSVSPETGISAGAPIASSSSAVAVAGRRRGAASRPRRRPRRAPSSAVRHVRDVLDEEELRRVARAARLRVRDLRRVDARADVVPQVLAQHVEERDEHGHLQHQRQAGCERVDLVLLVELHRLLLETLLVVLVLGLQLLELQRDPLHRLHRADLLERQRDEGRADDDRQEDDREAPAEADVVVEEQHHALERVDERLEDVGDREHHGRAGPGASA